MQRSFNKYGVENFKFEVIEYCDKSILYEREQYYIDLYQVCENGYNICPVVGSRLGMKCSIESRKRISDVKKGRKLTEEHKRKISEAGKGRIFSEESKRKIGMANKKALTGRKMPEEIKLKISLANKGKKKPPMSDEHRRNLSLSHKGKILSLESIKKRTETQRNNRLKQLGVEA